MTDPGNPLKGAGEACIRPGLRGMPTEAEWEAFDALFHKALTTLLDFIDGLEDVHLFVVISRVATGRAKPRELEELVRELRGMPTAELDAESAGPETAGPAYPDDDEEGGDGLP